MVDLQPTEITKKLMACLSTKGEFTVAKSKKSQAGFGASAMATSYLFLSLLSKLASKGLLTPEDVESIFASAHNLNRVNAKNAQTEVKYLCDEIDEMITVYSVFVDRLA